MKCLILSLVLIAAITSPVLGSLCDKCGNESLQDGPVETYCREQENLTMVDQCCVSGNATNFTHTDIVGIDLRNCSLYNVTNLFNNMTSVVIISLEDNPLSMVSERNFYNLTKLDYLSLPSTVDSCPGGSEAWKKSKLSDDVLLCKNQVNTCKTIENNGTCPSPQSYCVPAGPGMVDCLCSQDYHGYKCLRKGTFPTIPFVGGICGSTFVTAIVLWVTQRRFVKKH